MILLSDANVLMDLGHVHGLNTLTRMAPVEVLDVVLAECDHHSQPSLVSNIRAAGITEIKEKKMPSTYLNTGSDLNGEKVQTDGLFS